MLPEGARVFISAEGYEDVKQGGEGAVDEGGPASVEVLSLSCESSWEVMSRSGVSFRGGEGGFCLSEPARFPLLKVGAGLKWVDSSVFVDGQEAGGGGGGGGGGGEREAVCVRASEIDFRCVWTVERKGHGGRLVFKSCTGQRLPFDANPEDLLAEAGFIARYDEWTGAFSLRMPTGVYLGVSEDLRPEAVDLFSRGECLWRLRVLEESWRPCDGDNVAFRWAKNLEPKP
jgi:hypothetical protein